MIKLFTKIVSIILSNKIILSRNTNRDVNDGLKENDTLISCPGDHTVILYI